jgi:hypothetical protein
MQSVALIVGLAILASCCVGAYAIYRHARRNRWDLDNGQLIARYVGSVILPMVGLFAFVVIMLRR